MKVKRSTIPYAGYEYQTLQGVYILAKWLNNPNRYAKVAFDADEDDTATPKGIDDIVCEQPNEVREFWQVKFTPSPEKNFLDWKWLLKKEGTTNRSRSILKKLSDAILSVDTGKLGTVILITNRRPDRDMESCLKDRRIIFSKISPTIQSKIINHLDNKRNAETLFSILEIHHSEGDVQILNKKVRSELFRYSDDVGIERLLNRSREWAIHKDTPSQNGWIYLHNIRELLSSKRPEPIPELFTISDDYCLPDNDFHEDLVNKIISSPGEVITLTGQPGLGKSTYLSFLCQTLEKQNIPLIRHHYFLSLNDTTNDRFSPRIVAESLLDQINDSHKRS